jgi:hypothetical protein
LLLQRLLVALSHTVSYGTLPIPFHLSSGEVAMFPPLPKSGSVDKRIRQHIDRYANANPDSELGFGEIAKHKEFPATIVALHDLCGLSHTELILKYQRCVECTHGVKKWTLMGLVELDLMLHHYRHMHRRLNVERRERGINSKHLGGAQTNVMASVLKRIGIQHGRQPLKSQQSEELPLAPPCGPEARKRIAAIIESCITEAANLQESCEIIEDQSKECARQQWERGEEEERQRRITLLSNINDECFWADQHNEAADAVITDADAIEATARQLQKEADALEVEAKQKRAEAATLFRDVIEHRKQASEDKLEASRMHTRLVGMLFMLNDKKEAEKMRGLSSLRKREAGMQSSRVHGLKSMLGLK